jgi:glycosyltransferase involved in cell wall biosynthesis
MIVPTRPPGPPDNDRTAHTSVALSSPSGTASAVPRPRRVLFVFAWLVVGGEETEVRLLARLLDPARYRLEVVACFRKATMTEQTHEQLSALGVPVDRTPYALSFEDTVAYLADKILRERYDLIVACQAVPDVYPALAQLAAPPPLIEHGGLVEEALRGPKGRTARYIGVCTAIRDAAACRMPERPHHALVIPSMVDLSEFDPAERETVRAEWGAGPAVPIIGWVGRLDRKKRVEDFLHAAAILHRDVPTARFVVIGGPDAFMPEYADALRALVDALGLGTALTFLGDRPDVPRLLSGLDILAWLARGEGMPHVIAEAGAARLPVVATRDNGTTEQIVDGYSGLFVPHEDPPAAAAAFRRLLAQPMLRRHLGAGLRRTVEREYDAVLLTRRWTALFDEVLVQAADGEVGRC